MRPPSSDARVVVVVGLKCEIIQCFYNFSQWPGDGMCILKLAGSSPMRVRAGIPGLFKISASTVMAVNMALKPYFIVGL